MAKSNESQNTFTFLGIAIGGSVAGLVVAAIMLASSFAIIQSRQNTEATTIYAQQYQTFMKQRLVHLQKHLQSVAQMPGLTQLLLDDNKSSLSSRESDLRFAFPSATTIKLLTKADIDAQGSNPEMGFAGLEMLRDALNGKRSPAEAFTKDGLTFINVVEPIRTGDNAKATGVLFVAFDINEFTELLTAFDPNKGQATLTQKFSTGPAQTLFTFGTADANKEPITLQVENPNWQLSFIPGPSARSGVSDLTLWIPFIIAAAAVLVSVIFGHLLMNRNLRKNATLLLNFSQNLGNNRQKEMPPFTIELFSNVAQTLSRIVKQHADVTDLKKSRAEPASAGPATGSSEEALDIDILDELEENQVTTTDKTEVVANSTLTPPTMDTSVFRAYDIRGIIDKSLTPDFIYFLGLSIGTEAQHRSGHNNIIVAADGRLSSPKVSQQLCKGLTESGCNVTHVGTVPTPLCYYATHEFNINNGVMITGSHNPKDYNGFKIVLAGDTLANDDIQVLRQRIEKNNLKIGATGAIERKDIVDDYIDHVSNDVAFAQPLKVVVDCGNGVAGDVAPSLLETLGCDVIPLFCEVDGNFPNHHPDPGKPENLVDLIAKVKEEKADLGIAFDGDGDRLGVVTNTGKIIFPDRLMMLFAKDVIARNPGADIIYDVKCSRLLANIISEAGGRPIMWKTGHSLIKAKMKETGALLAGEMSGHIFFKERWFGFDDGIYSAARLIEILSAEAQTVDEIFSKFPDSINTPEINIETTEERKFKIVAALQKHGKFGDGNITKIDGVRVDYEDGWGLVRASNTTPMLVLRFEADTNEALERIKKIFKDNLAKIDKTLPLTF